MPYRKQNNNDKEDYDYPDNHLSRHMNNLFDLQTHDRGIPASSDDREIQMEDTRRYPMNYSKAPPFVQSNRHAHNEYWNEPMYESSTKFGRRENIDTTPVSKYSAFVMNGENESPFGASSPFCSPSTKSHILFSPPSVRNHPTRQAHFPSHRPVTMQPTQNPISQMRFPGYHAHVNYNTAVNHNPHQTPYYRPYSYAMKRGNVINVNGFCRQPLGAIPNPINNNDNMHLCKNNDDAPLKKTRLYRRKDKSLGLLCENFMSRYGDSTAKMSGDECAHISIDTAASDLGVERRRIYDIINILESIQIVSRKCKNTYNWHGTSNLPAVLSKLQRVAAHVWRVDAAANGITCIIDAQKSSKDPGNKSSKQCTSFSEDALDKEFKSQRLKSLGKLSQEFLHLFLVGNEVVNLNEATEKIVGITAIDDTTQNKNKRQEDKSACWMKTKSRRLYDIANVLASIGIITRVHGDGSSANTNKNRGSFRWRYAIKPCDLPAYFSNDNIMLDGRIDDSQEKNHNVTKEKLETKNVKDIVEDDDCSEPTHSNKSRNLENQRDRNGRDGKDVEKLSAQITFRNNQSTRRSVSNLFSPVLKKKRKH